MEAEREISASNMPTTCIDERAVDQSNAEKASNLQFTSQVSNHAGKDEEKALEQTGDFTEPPFDDLPDQVTEAKERANNPKENLEEVSSAEHQLQSSILVGEKRIKALESEHAHLIEELNASKDKVSDLNRQLQGAMEHNDKLLSQVDALNKVTAELEKKLADSNEKNEAGESLSEQVHACRMELATKTEALESISKAHSDLQLELQGVQSKSQDSVSTIKEQVSNLEATLKSAQDELQAKDAAASLLEAENANLKSQISEISMASEERLKQLEKGHQEELKVHEKTCEDLQKFVSEAEERGLNLQDSLAVARSEVVAAREEVADLQLEQERLSQNKNEFEQVTSELQLRLESMEEKASKQEEIVKAAEEKLKTSREEVSSLQQQLADLMLKEARSAEHLKDVEEGSQRLQLELQSELENLQATIPQLEEKVAQLESLLSASELDRDGARKKVSELEVDLKGLHENHGELSEKAKLFEEKCSQHETTAHTSRAKIMDLEGLITEFNSKADDLNTKVATLEAALLDSQNRETDLELQLKLAKHSSLMLEDRSVARIAEVEESFKEYVSKNKELKEMLVDRQNEIDSSVSKINELKLSVGALESDLKNATEKEILGNEERISVGEELKKLGALSAKLEAEKRELEVSMQEHKSLVEKGKTDLDDAFALEKELKGTITTLQATISELQGLLMETEEEKQAIANKLESLTKSFTELNDQLLEERQQLQEQIEKVVQENEALRHKVVILEEKLHVAITAEEHSAKQVQEGFLKASTLTGQLEDLKIQLKKAHDTCAHVETLEQEKGVLANEFATAQEKLRAMFEAAELSARELEAASLQETTLKAEAEDLKVQLEKAMDACSQVVMLEDTLKNSISREEHQMQIDKMLAASRLAETKVADLEEQLLKSKLEMKNAQISKNGQETHVRDLDLNTAKAVEMFERQPSDSGISKSRELDSDMQSPGKPRIRKKKGVTWESDLLLKPQAVQKPSHYLLNSYVVLMLVALVSLTTGFWLASQVDV